MSFLSPMRDTFEVYEDKAGEFRWRRQARNGRIVAESGEGYQTRQGVERAVNREKGTDLWFAAWVMGVVLGVLLSLAMGGWLLTDEVMVDPSPGPTSPLTPADDTGGIPVPEYSPPATLLPDAPQEPTEDAPQPGEPEPHG